jgi:AcrR family transcriptional regulator
MVRPVPQIDSGPSGQRKERADAARNRAKVLHAAERLFAEKGMAAVTMDDVAARARVGKGTLYRRFGDKSGLAAALLDEREAELQQRLLTGPPPLGPGAPPTQRLVAFVDNYLEYLTSHLDLVKMSQTASPGARLRTGSHQLWQHHCRILLAEANAADPDIRADALMAALTAEQVEYWLAKGKPLEEITSALARMAADLAGDQ